jgi:phage tail-like protein
MDANGQNFCQLSSAAHWQLLDQPSGLEFDDRRRSLRLAHLRREARFADDPALAEQRLLITPQTRDRYGNTAGLETESNRILATGLAPGIAEIYDPDDDDAVISDIVMGYDDVLYIAIDGRIVMQDRRERWSQPTVEVPSESGFKAWRMAADPQGGVWVLDRDNRQLARVHGMPLHKLSQRTTIAEIPERCEQNTNPPRMTLLNQANWPEDEQPVALACNEQSQLVLLSWVEGEDARVRVIDEQLALSSAMQLSGSARPYSIAWLSQHRVAVLLAGVNQEAPVYRVDVLEPSAFPLGELYPLKKDFDQGPFVHGLNYPPHYSTVDSSRALHRLSFPFYSREGQAINDPANAVMDGGEANHHWHRLYIDAVIPRDCGIKIWLAATNEVTIFNDILPEHWYEHRFGRIFTTTTRSDIPVAAWEPFASELPYQSGSLPCEIKRNEAGVFSVLIQRSSRRVRNLTGRYLHVQVQLTGQGRNTPELFSVRAYGSRFSYVDQYLPQLYRETLYAPDADNAGAATAADFLTRMVTNFEGVLTQIEDRVAQSYLLTDPMKVPAENLSWLASWTGLGLNQSLPETVQRCFVQSAAELNRWHGTLRGLKLALEIATRGAVSGGEIVVLEDFRLRRTFASIIGADLEDENDPLTAGVSVSGNSFVGDTLFVGDENRKEFIALFSADLPVDTSEQSAIEQLFDRLAHRITILVHETVQPQDLGLIKQIAKQETPAHVAFRVLPASHAFLVGMSALVGVDSYLAHRAKPAAAQLGTALLGKNNFIKGPAALDARLQGYGSGSPIGAARRPVAFAPDVTAGFGDDISLDGSDSRAFGDRFLTQYNWTYINKGD